VDDPLKQLRARIDTLDDELLKLLSERARMAQEVGRAKNGEMIYRPEREAQIVRRLTDANPGPLEGEVVECLFREIMSACRALEQDIRVAYLGPAGTFSQAAVFKQFGHEITALPEADIDACLRSVETGRADFAVVPVENSTEGVISRTLDLIVTSPLKICGEVMLPIHQNLMRKLLPSPASGAAEGSLRSSGEPAGVPLAGEGAGGEGAYDSARASARSGSESPCGANAGPKRIDGIKRVYGHAQSLAQCQQWLNRHLPHAERISVVSNSEGAQRAATEPDAATLGSEGAAELYGLNIVETRVEDEAGNTTRFLVLAPHDAAPSGCDKTSFVMGAHNQPGAIVKLLQPLADAGISMSKLESRPARSANWEYLFFVVCEGHREDAKLSATLAEIGKRAAFLKILGSYPQASL
jgi:chorismate mutase / prephenate dehydratase